MDHSGCLHLTRHREVSTRSVWTQGRQSSPALAERASGPEKAGRWKSPHMQLYAGARSGGAGPQERRMWKMHLGGRNTITKAPTKGPITMQSSTEVPLAILMRTPMVPIATTGGGLVTAYRERKSAARFKSDASYSHWTCRLKTTDLSLPIY